VWLLNTTDTLAQVREFAEDANLEGPMLYDAWDPYNRYFTVNEGTAHGYAPYPMQVVVDPEGLIRLITHQYDAPTLHAALDAATE